MSLLGAVAPKEVPQTGVKRPLLGSNPSAVPANQPAFRGRSVATPEQPIKVPKLSQGNNPNSQTNVAIPLSRVCPLEFLSGWTGRLAPGDVAFVVKYPPGFLSKQPLGSSGTNGTATMSRVIGLDGVNRLLHGAHSDEGWAVGHNVLVVDAGSSPMEVLSNSVLGGFTLDALDAVRLDGIVKSNDEPFASTSSGGRDSVVFNNVIQGPTLVNNGFLFYESSANPTEVVTGAVPGGAQSRGVEAHARGTHEGGYHVGGSSVNRSGEWLRGRNDYVATFSGTHTKYPCQMFDRAVTPLSTLFLGLRAYELTNVDTLTQSLRKDDKSEPGSWFASQPEVVAAIQALGPNPNAAAVANAKTAVQAAVLSKKAFYFYQIMPFSSRAAHLCQLVRDGENAIRSDPNDSDAEKAHKLVKFRAKLNGMLPSHRRGEERSRFDKDVFDAVRTADLVSMVGAWTVGRVLDVAAMRNSAYHGGPSDTSFALTVDVQISFRRAFFALGGSAATVVTIKDTAGKTTTVTKTAAENARDNRSRVEYGTNDMDREGKRKWDKSDATDPRRAEEQLRKDQLAVDAYNAQFSSMQQAVGPLFGAAMGEGGLPGTGTPETALAAVEEALRAVERSASSTASPEQERGALKQLMTALAFLQRQSAATMGALEARRKEVLLEIQRTMRALQEKRAAATAAATKAAAARGKLVLKTTTTRPVTTSPTARALYARELQQHQLGASAMERVRALVDVLDPDLPDAEKRVARPYPERIADSVTPAVFAAEYVTETRQRLTAFEAAHGASRTQQHANRQRALEAQFATTKAFAAMAAIDAAQRSNFTAARAQYQTALDAELVLVRARLSKALPRAGASDVARVAEEVRGWTQDATSLVQRYVEGAQALDPETEKVYRVLLFNAELRFQVFREFAEAFLGATTVREALLAQEARDKRTRREAAESQRDWLADAEARVLRAEEAEEALDARTRQEALDAQRAYLTKEEARVLREESIDSPAHQALMQRLLSAAFVDSAHHHHDLHQLAMAHLSASGFGGHGLLLPGDDASHVATHASKARTVHSNRANPHTP